jgi:hypothetical protein
VIRDGHLWRRVNIAARLEALADPGGTCVSRVVHEQVREKLDLAFEDMSEQQVKNIARPVHVWCIRLGAKPAVPAPERLPLSEKPSVAVLPFANMSGDRSRKISPTEWSRRLSPQEPHPLALRHRAFEF